MTPRNCKECPFEISIQLSNGVWIHKCDLLDDLTERVRERKRLRNCPEYKGDANDKQRMAERNERQGVGGETCQSGSKRCVCFKKAAEFTEKYLHKGSKIVVSGRIQTGSYTNKDGQKVYTTDVIVSSQEFAESKGSEPTPKKQDDGFMNIPDNIEDEIPFK